MSAGFEPSLRGPWPKKQYHELFNILREMTGELALLSNAWTRSKPRNAKYLVQTPFFDPPLVSVSRILRECCVLCLTSLII